MRMRALVLTSLACTGHGNKMHVADKRQPASPIGQHWSPSAPGTTDLTFSLLADFKHAQSNPMEALATHLLSLSDSLAGWQVNGQSGTLARKDFSNKHLRWKLARMRQDDDLQDDVHNKMNAPHVTRRSLLALLAAASVLPCAAIAANSQTSVVQGLDLMKAAVRRNGMTFLDGYPAPPLPKAGSEEVLVRVRSAAVNPVDYKAPKMILGEVFGLDFAGTVEVVAEGTPKHGLKVGDEVFGTTMGSLADFSLVADGGRLARKPVSLSFVQAAAVPTVYLTGLQALRDYGDLRQGGRVLVIGASGGCGLAGIQLAKNLGAAQVVGVCSSKNREIVLRSGADQVVDYTTEQISALFGSMPEEQKFDVVYDCASGSGAGEDYQAEARRVLKRETGQYVPINGGTMLWLRYLSRLQAKNTHLFLTNPNRPDLETLSRMIAGKSLEPVIAEILPFTADGVERGFALLKSRRTVGKIVFDMGLALVS